MQSQRLSSAAAKYFDPENASSADFAPRASIFPRVLCTAHLTLAIAAVATWLIALTLIKALATNTAINDWLTDPAIAAPVLVLCFLCFEARLVRRGARSATPKVELTLSLLVLHIAVLWYTVLGVALTLPAQRMLVAVHAALLYVMLLALVYLRWRLAAHLPSRVTALEDEVREQRVQYRALSALMQHRDLGEDESDYEGDEREHLIVPPAPVAVPDAIKGMPEHVLPHALNGLTYDGVRATKIAQRIRKKGYSIAAFYDDVRMAFPELQLYLAQHARAADDPAGIGNKPNVTSGLDADDEYRRSIGAMFAVYWLMRIGIDGERGFSFGVDDEWVPHEAPTPEEMSSAPSKSQRGGPKPPAKRTSTSGDAGADGVAKVKSTLKEPAKRLAFYEKQDWGRLQQLLIDSGMLERDASEIGGVKVVIERTVAMLALTVPPPGLEAGRPGPQQPTFQFLPPSLRSECQRCEFVRRCVVRRPSTM